MCACVYSSSRELFRLDASREDPHLGKTEEEEEDAMTINTHTHTARTPSYGVYRVVLRPKSN